MYNTGYSYSRSGSTPSVICRCSPPFLLLDGGLNFGVGYGGNGSVCTDTTRERHLLLLSDALYDSVCTLGVVGVPLLYRRSRRPLGR